jgi:hypothetical protein
MSLILNILHYSIYFISFFALISIIFKGNKAKLESYYIASFLLIQSIYNGCPITTIQNYFWVQEGYNPAKNEFILTSLYPENVNLLRITTLAISLFLIFNVSKTPTTTHPQTALPS